jgi:hypothetical protein
MITNTKREIKQTQNGNSVTNIEKRNDPKIDRRKNDEAWRMEQVCRTRLWNEVSLQTMDEDAYLETTE